MTKLSPFTILVLTALNASAAEPKVDFSRDVAPILERHCVRCHQPDNLKGDVSLVTPKDLPAGDKLLSLVSPRSNNRPPRMPKEGKPISEAERLTLKNWVAGGSVWPKGVVLKTRAKADKSWWSLQPLGDAQPPNTEGAPAGWAEHPIDRFIFAGLKAKGLTPSPPAVPATLIRRLCYDLTGLPPTPEQVEAFIKDPSPAAYEKLVDDLLASPAYGERWGRHWLDVVRFGESNGFERNILIENLWPFRDYVIQSFNDDKPFDRMLLEHLAGDRVGPGDPAVEVGTAFLVCGPYDNVGNQDAEQAAVIRANTIDETIRGAGEAFLGLTIGCARCHDHKFDPILAKDYYRFYATFAGVSPGPRKVGNANDWLGKLQKITGPSHVFLGGDPQKKGDAVTPASPSFLGDALKGYELPADAPEADRRLALAKWMVSPDNPLTPRVLANRVWHYHFGTGINETPSDFGFMGGRPSHPELLDWLAKQLQANGWKLKPLHKLIVTSQTYKQSAASRPGPEKIDGDDRLLWRFPPRRLSGEEVRDSMLAVAGKLDPKRGGPGFKLYKYVQDNVATYHALDNPGPETYRRAVYHMNARAARVDVLTDFDCPDPAFADPNRASTTTPLQSLTLFNHQFTLDMATALADRLKKEAGEDVGTQIRRAFMLAYGRPPTDAESAACHKVIADHGLRSFGRAMLNSNEFLFVE